MATTRKVGVRGNTLCLEGISSEVCFAAVFCVCPCHRGINSVRERGTWEKALRKLCGRDNNKTMSDEKQKLQKNTFILPLFGQYFLISKTPYYYYHKSKSSNLEVDCVDATNNTYNMHTHHICMTYFIVIWIISKLYCMNIVY